MGSTHKKRNFQFSKWWTGSKLWLKRLYSIIYIDISVLYGDQISQTDYWCSVLILVKELKRSMVTWIGVPNMIKEMIVAIFFCLLTHILTIILYCISFRQVRSALPKPVLSGHSHNPWQGSPRHEMRAIYILVSVGGLDMCLIDMCLIICG